MLSTMVRPEDTIRVPRSYHSNTEEEAGNKGTPEPNAPSFSSCNEGAPKSEDEMSPSNGPASSDGNNTNNGNAKPQAGTKLLSQEETTEIARRAVENGIQETKRSMAGNEAVSDVVKPKLTIDLGHSNIVCIPEPVVDIIKDEVERYVDIGQSLQMSRMSTSQLGMKLNRQTLIVEQSHLPHPLSFRGVFPPAIS